MLQPACLSQLLHVHACVSLHYVLPRQPLPQLAPNLRCPVLPHAQVRYRLKHDPLVEFTFATQLRTR